MQARPQGRRLLSEVSPGQDNHWQTALLSDSDGHHQGWLQRIMPNPSKAMNTLVMLGA